jgi:pimeloyl-ACP methyl ester carboxylesterase
MDQTKEVFPKAFHNVALSRGFHVLAMDGPGQGNSNLQKIRAVKDNYERAGAAVIRYLTKRPEVDSKKIAIYGISMGSYWSLRLSSYDHRAAAVVSSVACFNPNNTIFTQSSPRFKQMFMYMAGYENEEKFDDEVAKGMTVRGLLGQVKCPTLLVTGEFDRCARWRTPSKRSTTSRSPRRCGSSRTSTIRSGESRTWAAWTATTTSWTGSSSRFPAGASRRSGGASRISGKAATGRGAGATGRRRSSRAKPISDEA